MPPFATVRPSRLAWAFLITAPALLIPGVVLLLSGRWAWATPCLLAAVFNTVASARIVRRWRQVRRGEPAGARLTFTSAYANDSFLRDDVGWAPAHFHVGWSSQPGWVVVRPGWVAFLPKEPLMPLGLQAVLLLGRRFFLGAVVYDFVRALHRGLPVFDATVLEAASQGGRVFFPTGGFIGKWGKNGTLFLTDGDGFVATRASFPTPVVSSWRTRRVAFDAARAALAFGIVSSVPAAIGVVFGGIAYARGASTVELCVGVGFWALLAAAVWVGFAVAARRAMRAAASVQRSTIL